MKFVNLNTAIDLLDAGWHEDAARALEEACAATTPGERKDCVNRHAEIWRRAGREFIKLSAGKCWYCEVREARSDMPVDHFRPKGAVAEDDMHPGYWWLAFSPDNLRCACTFCNSRRKAHEHGSDGGKGTHFPLEPGSPRAYSDHDDVLSERPLLLDPCNPEDPPLLSFRQDGMPVPSKTEGEQSIQHLRAAESIKCYHLDHYKLVRMRKDLWRQVDALVEIGRELQEAGSSLDEVKARLFALIERTHPLARVAHMALRGHRDKDWVSDWLEEIETTL